MKVLRNKSFLAKIYLFKSASDPENEVKVTKIQSALKLVLVVHLKQFGEIHPLTKEISYIQDSDLENRVNVTKTKSTL